MSHDSLSFLLTKTFQNHGKCYCVSTKNISRGKEYYAIQLQSEEIEFLISNTTGRPYATLRKCWITSTFDEATCKRMIGKSITGSIIKEECDPYTYVKEETGEQVIISFRNTYCSDSQPTIS